MPNPWRHAVCEKCWAEMNPGRQAFRATDTTPAKCCKCGDKTDGIFVREDPAKMACGGIHE